MVIYFAALNMRTQLLFSLQRPGSRAAGYLERVDVGGSTQSDWRRHHRGGLKWGTLKGHASVE